LKTDWEDNHALAYEALLKSFDKPTLNKVYQLETANEIWKRPSDEYGHISDHKCAAVEAAFHHLEKAPLMPMKNYIDQFTVLQQEVDYHQPEGISPMSSVQINLIFVRSLGNAWENFHESISTEAQKMKTEELYAQVTALDESRQQRQQHHLSQLHEAQKLYKEEHSSESHQGIVALATSNWRHNTPNQNRYHGRGGSRGSYRGHNYRGGDNGNSGHDRGNHNRSNHSNSDYDEDGNCRYSHHPNHPNHPKQECYKRCGPTNSTRIIITTAAMAMAMAKETLATAIFGPHLVNKHYGGVAGSSTLEISIGNNFLPPPTSCHLLSPSPIVHRPPCDPSIHLLALEVRLLFSRYCAPLVLTVVSLA
jgi:gag-polypeptide of LTR copia-type